MTGSATSSSPRATSSRCPTSPPTIRATFCSANGTANSPKAGDEAGIACNAKGRGALIADFNLDGRLDILQINRGSNALLYRNLGAKNGDGPPLPMGNWSEIRLIEPNPNRNAVGAKISIKTGTRTPDPLRRRRRRRRLRPRGLHPCRPRHGRARGNPGAMARRRLEPDPTACSPTSSWSSTARSRRPPTGIRGGRKRPPRPSLRDVTTLSSPRPRSLA